ncbi:MAG TPA: TolC family protein [Thermoanaerobaculia bacterium]|nr:TolC family protein [Thermoanaerobaculia bacterium]
MRGSLVSRLLRTGAVLLAALLGAGAGRAEPASARPAPGNLGVAPPEIRVARISLPEALRLTLDHAPEVLVARQEVARRAGILRTNVGAFDNLLLFTPQFERDIVALTPMTLRGEVLKRQFLTESSENLSLIASDIAKGLTDDKGFALPDCQGRQYYINGSAICTDVVRPTDVQTFQLLIDAQAKAADVPQDTPSARLAAALAEQQRQRMTMVLALLRRVFIPALNQQLQAIGALPSLNDSETFTFDLRYSIPTRTGLTVAPVFWMNSTRDNYVGKSNSPAGGGKGIPTLYRSVLGFTLDLPLLRNGGRDSVTAAERSAQESWRASLESLANIAAQACLRTTLAYWNLASAQEQLALIEGASEIQQKIADVTQALVQADELPRTEMNRVVARTADLAASAAAARRNIATYRVELARSAGISVVDEETAPLAADPLPAAEEAAAIEGPALASLLDASVARRADVKAAKLRIDAANAVVVGTRSDLRPRLDLSLQAGYNGIYEDGRYQVTGVFNPTGYWRTFQGKYVGPSFQLTLTFELPFGNNTAKGQLAQAEALATQSIITEKNVERQTRATVEQLAKSLQLATSEVKSQRTAARSYDETVASTFEQFRAGETTLFSTLTTEQNRTQALANLVSARLTWAARLARLRYATGTLLSYTIDDRGVSFGVVNATGPVTAATK